MKIGFACKYVHPDRSLSKRSLKEIESAYNMSTTTAKWCRDNPDSWEERLWYIAANNVRCIHKLIEYVGSLPHYARMVRISSDVFPLYTHAEFSSFYKQPAFYNTFAPLLLKAGNLARKLDVRLSMHPGQFVVLASDRPEVVKASIEEFEYHVDVIRMMGYGKRDRDFKCNVHLSGAAGASGYRKAYTKLSPEARNVITLENDEFGCGLDDILVVSKLTPIVLDIHHHWINTGGQYILPTDDRVKRVVDSWRGHRPVLHYSYSREEVLLAAGHDDTVNKRRPVFSELTQPRTKLRAHSDFYPNPSANRWALGFLSQFDIMCESKMKNLASLELIDFALNHYNVIGE